MIKNKIKHNNPETKRIKIERTRITNLRRRLSIFFLINHSEEDQCRQRIYRANEQIKGRVKSQRNES